MALKISLCCCKFLRNFKAKCVVSQTNIFSKPLPPHFREIQKRHFAIASNIKIFNTIYSSHHNINGNISNPSKINLSNYLFYSTSKTDDIKGIADQILRVNIEESQSEKEEKQKEREKKKKYMNYGFLFFGITLGGLSALLIYSLGKPQFDENGELIIDEYHDLPWMLAHLKRAWREILNFKDSIRDPSRDKLLPDPLPEPYYQPPYTLVVEMTDVLIHPDWTYRTGWRFKKRPGVDYFIQSVSYPFFEMVIYTHEQGTTAHPILMKLDPEEKIPYRLYRDTTRYIRGHHVKDLSCLNRDPKKIIFLDWDSKSFQLQPENALKLKRWQGDDHDSTLLDLVDFLHTIRESKVDDVRPVLQYYKQFDDPVAAFRENKKKLKEIQEAAMKEQQKPKVVGGWGSSLFGSSYKKSY